MTIACCTLSRLELINRSAREQRYDGWDENGILNMSFETRGREREHDTSTIIIAATVLRRIFNTWRHRNQDTPRTKTIEITELNDAGDTFKSRR